MPTGNRKVTSNRRAQPYKLPPMLKLRVGHSATVDWFYSQLIMQRQNIAQTRGRQTAVREPHAAFWHLIAALPRWLPLCHKWQITLFRIFLRFSTLTIAKFLGICLSKEISDVKSWYFKSYDRESRSWLMTCKRKEQKTMLQKWK